MKNFAKMLMVIGIALFAGFNSANAQFGCGSAVVIADGYTATGITTPGTGGIEDWNTNPTGTSISGSYWDDDVYLFEYTAGATAENISMTINTANTWTGIGIFDDCTGTSFSNELDASGSSASGNKTVSAVIAAGNTVYIAVGQWGTPNDLNFDVTDFTVTVISCVAPSGITASNITATSADINWTAGNMTQLGWEVSVVTAGNPAVAGTASATTSYNSTGLSDDTSYDVYVREICAVGDTTPWQGPVSFSTPCLTITPAYLTDFSTFTPSCWVEADNGSEATGPNTLGSGSWAQSGTLARINLFTTGKSDWLVSPIFDLSAGGWELVIEASGQDFGASAGTFSGMGSDDSVQVVMSTDGGTTWTSIYTFDATNQPAATATDYILDLSAYTGTNNQFGILAKEGAVNDPEDYYANIHSFEIRQPLTCADPTMLAVTNITATSADVTWTAGNVSQAGWEVSIVPTGNGAMGGTAAGATTYNATGLMDDSSYDVYVREICAAGDTTAWLGPIAFNTPCAVITPTYLTDFATFTPACWDEADNGSVATGPTNFGSGSWGQSGTLARTNLYTTGKSDWLVSPTFDLSTGPWELVVEASGQDYGAAAGTFSGMGSDDSLQVAITTDGGATWTSIYTFDVNNAPAATATDYVIDLSAYTGANNQFGILASEGAVNDLEDYYANIHSFEIRVPCVPTTGTDTQVACDSIVWNGMTYNTTGMYTWTGMNAAGCDSTVTLDLTINTTSTFTDVQTACDSIVWNGMTYNTTGMYTWTGMNAAGCDSIVTLDLTIATPSTYTDVQTTCDSIVWNGMTYNTAGMYTWTGMNAAGCDSIVTLDLTINAPSAYTDVQTGCDSIVWNGMTYNTTGMYTWTTTNAVGCDSIVTLDLTINNSSTYTDVQTACDSIVWNGMTYNTTGMYMWSTTNAAGCDSIVTLDLTINTADATVTTNDPSITANATGATYQWIDCDNNNSPIVGETSQTFTATANGNYAVMITDANGCEATSQCVEIVTVSLDALSPLDAISVYPNPVNNVLNINLAGAENVQVRLLDMSGKVLHTEDCGSTELFTMEFNQASGAYIVEVKSNEFVKQFKLIKE